MSTYRIGVPVQYKFECLECTSNAHTWQTENAPMMHQLAERHTEEHGHVTRVLQHGPGVRYSRDEVA